MFRPGTEVVLAGREDLPEPLAPWEMEMDLSVFAVLGKGVFGWAWCSWICVVGRTVVPQRLSMATGLALTRVATVARTRVNAVLTMLAV